MREVSPSGRLGSVLTRASERAPAILTLNAGSSSLKYALYVDGERIESAAVQRVGRETKDYASALEKALDAIGGTRHRRRRASRRARRPSASSRPRASTTTSWRSSAASPRSTPDHLPPEIALIEAMRARCRRLPAGRLLRHGVSREPAARRAPATPIPAATRRGRAALRVPRPLVRSTSSELAPAATPRAGASSWRTSARARASAPRATASPSTPRWASPPTAGIPMGTRSGDLDPGVLLYLMRTEGGLGVARSTSSSTERSGLLGVSGTSADMRDLLAREATDPRRRRRRRPLLPQRPQGRRRDGRDARRPRHARLLGRHRRERAAGARARRRRPRAPRRRSSTTARNDASADVVSDGRERVHRPRPPHRRGSHHRPRDRSRAGEEQSR